MRLSRRELLGSAAMLSLGGGSKERFQAAAREPLKPPRLREGSGVALVNPAGANSERMQLELAAERLSALGLRVKVGEHAMDRYGYLAGTDEQRAADLNRFFADPEIEAICAVRGGWGCARILPLLNYQQLRQTPKLLIGYSDITALHLALQSQAGVVSVHGPMGQSVWTDFVVDYFRRLLFSAEAVEYENRDAPSRDSLIQTEHRVQTLRSGKARGKLLGGNLTVLTALLGTPYVPDWEGALLFLEDVDEAIYRVDRMLTQLKLAGVLDEIAGFIFGRCTDCDPGSGYGSLSFDQLFEDHIVPLGIPAWSGAMIGHITDQYPLPVGVPAEMDADRGIIRLLEPAVS